MLMKCKQFLNLIIAQYPTLAQCPSNFLFDVPTLNEEANEKLLEVNFFLNVDINDDACSPLVWWANMIIVPNVVFFTNKYLQFVFPKLGQR